MKSETPHSGGSRHAETQDALHRTEHALRQVSGLLERPVVMPAWTLPAAGKPGRAVGLLHVSDWHVGEVVRADEIGGMNAYDPDRFSSVECGVCLRLSSRNCRNGLRIVALRASWSRSMAISSAATYTMNCAARMR